MVKIESQEELVKIEGGSSISSSYINAIINGVKVIFEIGRSIGSSIKRSVLGDMCPIP